MITNIPHLSFADLANKAKRDNFLIQERKEICGLFDKRKDNDDAYCTKNCHPKNVQLPQNLEISNAIRYNKTPILRKSKLSPTSDVPRKYYKNRTSSLIQNYNESTVATSSINDDEGELLCSNKGKYVDGNNVVCSSSHVTKSIHQDFY